MLLARQRVTFFDFVSKQRGNGAVPRLSVQCRFWRARGSAVPRGSIDGQRNKDRRCLLQLLRSFVPKGSRLRNTQSYAATKRYEACKTFEEQVSLKYALGFAATDQPKVANGQINSCFLLINLAILIDTRSPESRSRSANRLGTTNLGVVNKSVLFKV